MTDSPDAETFDNDPEIAELLKFEPVPRRFKRGDDGWTAPLQRAFIRHLAQHGSPGKACDALQKHRSGIDKVYKSPGADSFRAAWAKAVEIAETRAAARIEAEAAAMAGVKMPFRDNRRKAAAGPAEPEQLNDNGLPVDEEQMWDLVHNLGARFSRKVVAEREARLAGEIVAADFYLRQITFIEVMLDLSAKRLGWDASEMLRELRCGEHHITNIVSTPLADWLDRARRVWWAQEGEPERPPHPDVRFLQRHSTGDGECSTYVDQNAYGALTTPARGYTKEQWAEMGHEEQKRARQAQFDQDAAEQLAWEAAARREYEERRDSDASS